MPCRRSESDAPPDAFTGVVRRAVVERGSPPPGRGTPHHLAVAAEPVEAEDDGPGFGGAVRGLDAGDPAAVPEELFYGCVRAQLYPGFVTDCALELPDELGAVALFGPCIL